MNPQQQQGIQPLQGWRFLIFGIDCLGYCWEVFARVPRTMGRDYPGWPVRLGACCAFPLYFLLFPPRWGAEAAFIWWQVVLAAIAFQWIAGWKSRAEHSFYLGDSVTWRLWPRGSETGSRVLPELLLAFALAAFALILSDCIAKFIAVSALASATSIALVQERDRRILQQLRNQHVDARYYSERLQNDDGGRP